jgi:DNA processing protein
MALDARMRLRHAVASVRHGGGAATVSARVRREGLDAFESVERGLTDEQKLQVTETAERLSRQGVQAVLLGDEGYPASLAQLRSAPAALFVSGPRQILDRTAIGVCGSRNAGSEGLRVARACGEAMATAGLSVVSGYARGVDLAAHIGALASGGATVLVLAEGIDRFRQRSGEFSHVWDDTRATVISQFSPGQPWTASAAMTRNGVISGLCRALVVIEAGETGGTLAAGLHALDRGQPVLVLEPSASTPGNRILRERGALVVRSRNELEVHLRNLPTVEPAQLSLL